MAILHGSWLQRSSDGGCLFIWGETWRSLLDSSEQSTVTEVQPYPLAMTLTELNDFLRSRNIIIPNLKQSLSPDASSTTPAKGRSRKNTASTNPSLPSHTQIIALPTNISITTPGTVSIIPSYTANLGKRKNSSEVSLYPWQIEGFCLEPTTAIKFLTYLPLNAVNGEDDFIGGDLRFWSQVARWSLDLISRCKYLPLIERQTDASFIAKWQVLLDSAIDQTRLEKFSHMMPTVCRMHQGEIENKELSKESISSHSLLYIDLPEEPQNLLGDFLNNTVDAQVRDMLGSQVIIEPRIMTSLPIAVKQWLQALTSASNTITGDTVSLEKIVSTLKAWTLPLQYQTALINQFRTCFELLPPSEDETEWTLAYFIQAVDDPEFLVDAETIWDNPFESFVYQNRTITQPQETFLRGLGLASRLYPPIAPSLETPSPTETRLTPLQAYEFIKSMVWRFEDKGLGVVLPYTLTNRDGWANRLGLKISAQTGDKKQGRLGLESLLNFKWELAIGGQTLTKQEFDKLVALNSPLVEINGEWVELRPQDIKTAQTFFASRKDQMALSLEDALRLSSGDTQTIEKLPVVSFEASGALQDLITNLTNNKAIEPLPTPANFRGELRPYQARGVAWLSFLERWGLGACLADDMGLGKTVQFIALMLHLKEEEAIENPTLLVCPTSVLGNWEREVNKFAPKLKVLQYHGDKRPKGKAFLEIINKYDLVITSYSLVHRDLKILQSTCWQNIVLDEAQNVKNADAKQSQAIRQLQSKFRIALTGTPVENRLQELWSILDFLNPGYLGNKQFFQRRFAIPIEKYGDASSLNQLRSLVQPFILRRLKSDRDIIQDLPEKQEMTVFCGLSPEQATLYQRVVEDSLAEIDDAEGLQRRGMILGLLVKLKQICNHPGQYLKETNILQPRLSGKLLRLQEMLDEVVSAGDRALIFTQFAEWGKLLKPYLEKQLARETLFLYGSTSKKQREEMIDRFQNDPQAPSVMILSLKAGGVGLNLTRANHVFHFDRWWNPAVENQATDRVFRIGQTRNVQVHKFVCTGTLEEKIHDMIESKKQLAEQVVGGGEDWLTELDTDQLRNLLLLDRNAVIEEDGE
ncbi:MAG: DEAD/DEAH box helicase [Scytonematopsis contorta HA4267-MV1]|jgi:SNF2 family DNA or RNA helicase|nr:DEAD/DEAH box helicase [Scytonematopsis contorta HA4267-MV1]